MHACDLLASQGHTKPRIMGFDTLLCSVVSRSQLHGPVHCPCFQVQAGRSHKHPLSGLPPLVTSLPIFTYCSQIRLLLLGRAGASQQVVHTQHHLTAGNQCRSNSSQLHFLHPQILSSASSNNGTQGRPSRAMEQPTSHDHNSNLCSKWAQAAAMGVACCTP